MKLRLLWPLLKRTFSEWNAHDAPRLGAALAFYTILSMAPLVIVVMAIVAMVFGTAHAQDQLLSQVQYMIGQDGADAVKQMLSHAQKPATGTLASLVGIATLLFGASGVFGELRTTLNKIWDLKNDASGGLWSNVKERFFSFGMVLAVGFLLLVSLLASAALATLGKFFEGFLSVPSAVLQAINFIVSLVGISLLFALIYRYVPSQRIPWRQVAVGSVMTGVFFTLGKFLIGMYLGKAAVGSPYGAAGSLVVVTVWVYYSAMIFLFGAEFTHLVELPVRAPNQAPTCMSAPHTV